MAQWTHPALPFRFVTTLIALTCVTYIAAPWYGQKIFAARDERMAFRAVAWAAVLVFVLYGGLMLAAAHLRVVDPISPTRRWQCPTMIAAWLPSGARGAGFAVLFAAALTTLAGVWTAMAAMVAADFGWREARHVHVQRRVILAFAALHWLGAVFLVDDILNRLILANIPVVALSFALLAGFHWPRATTAGAWASVGRRRALGCRHVRRRRRVGRLHVAMGDVRHPVDLRDGYRRVAADRWRQAGSGEVRARAAGSGYGLRVPGGGLRAAGYGLRATGYGLYGPCLLQDASSSGARSRPPSVTTSTLRPSTRSSFFSRAAGNHGLGLLSRRHEQVDIALIGSLAPREGAEHPHITGAVPFCDPEDLLTLRLDEVRLVPSCVLSPRSWR